MDPLSLLGGKKLLVVYRSNYTIDGGSSLRGSVRGRQRANPKNLTNPKIGKSETSAFPVAFPGFRCISVFPMDRSWLLKGNKPYKGL